MKSKRFKSNTGYPVTVWATDDSGSSREIRVEADTAYETSDQVELAALEGSPEVSTVRESGSKK